MELDRLKTANKREAKVISAKEEALKICECASSTIRHKVPEVSDSPEKA